MAASGAVRAESFEEGHAGFFVGRWYMILVSFPNFASLTELLSVESVDSERSIGDDEETESGSEGNRLHGTFVTLFVVQILRE